MKIIIIGSSIAGAAAALALAGHAEVVVYEQKSRKEVGKKVCANIVTSSFLRYAKKLGLNPKKYIAAKFEHAFAFSRNNKVNFKTKEFKINREKFLNDLIIASEKKGVKFNFNINFVDFKRKNSGFSLILEKNGIKLSDFCDILVGADGALSTVAKKAGLWKNRILYLVMQTEIPLNKLKLKLEKNSYNIYFDERFGYYGYVFPCKNKAIIGVGDLPGNIKQSYHNFLKFLGVKGKGDVKAAFVPKPRIIPWKKNLFFVGDAGCQIKFSGGGIIPSIIAVFALKDFVVNKNCLLIKELKRSILFNKLFTRVLEKLNDEEFNLLLEIFKDSKFSDFVAKRDDLGKKEYSKMLDSRLIRFLLKLF